MRCQSRSPVDRQRCAHPQGHDGQHYAVVPWQKWGTEKTNHRRISASSGEQAVAEMVKHVRRIALELVREGAPLPASVGQEHFEWRCPRCGARLPSTETHCPCAFAEADL